MTIKKSLSVYEYFLGKKMVKNILVIVFFVKTNIWLEKLYLIFFRSENNLCHKIILDKQNLKKRINCYNVCLIYPYSNLIMHERDHAYSGIFSSALSYHKLI